MSSDRHAPSLIHAAVYDRCADRYIISGHDFRIVANALAAAEREAAELRARTEAAERKVVAVEALLNGEGQGWSGADTIAQAVRAALRGDA